MLFPPVTLNFVWPMTLTYKFDTGSMCHSDRKLSSKYTQTTELPGPQNGHHQTLVTMNIYYVKEAQTQNIRRVSAAADRPAQRWASAHAIYSVSHHTVIKPFLLLGLAAEYRSRRWVWSTAVRRPSEVCDTHRRTKLTVPETINRSTDVKNRCLNLPHLYLATLLGVILLEFRLHFWHQETRVPGLEHWLVADRQKDGQTHDDGKYCVIIALRKHNKSNLTKRRTKN